MDPKGLAVPLGNLKVEKEKADAGSQPEGELVSQEDIPQSSENCQTTLLERLELRQRWASKGQDHS